MYAIRSYYEFGALHPFAPAEQAAGYAKMLTDLSAKLCEITRNNFV